MNSTALHFRNLLALLALVLVSTAAANVTLTASSPAGSTVLHPGDTFDVDLTWSGTPNIAAADYYVTLSNSLITLTGRDFNASLATYSDTPYVASFPSASTQVDVTWFKTTPGFTAGKDVTLHFQIPAIYYGGNCTITPTITAVQDSAAAAITSTTGTPLTIQIANTPNSPPTISTVANQSTNEDTATASIPFTVGDVETPATSLTVTGSSSNTTLVPNANIVTAGTTTSRTVTITPAANQYGSATITLSVSDGTNSTPTTFTLTVNSVNDAPTISDVANQSIYINGNTGALPFTVGDIETTPASLTVTATSSNQSVVPDGNIALGGTTASRTVTVTPATGQTGSAIITLTVSDGSLTATDTFTLTVTTVVASTTGSASDTGTVARTVNWITSTPTNWFTWDSASIPGTGLTYDTANVTLTSSSTSGDYTIDFNQNLNLQTINLTMKGTVNYLFGTGTRRTVTWNNNGTGTAAMNFIASTGNPLRNKFLANSVLNTDLEVKFRYQGAKDGQFGGIVSGPGKLTVNYASNVNNSAAGASYPLLIGTASDAASTHAGGTSLINSANNANTNTSSAFTWKAAKVNAFGTGMLELSTVKLDLNNFTQTVGGLGGGTGSSIILNGAAGTKTLTLDFPSSAGIRTYSGAIQTGTGEIALTKTGTGTQVLSGANTYTGTTTVTGGTLLVNGSLALGSTVNVGSNGTLGGTGTVYGPITSLGTIAPGASVGTLTAGVVALSADSKMDIEFSNWDGTPGSGWDHLNCATSLAINGTVADPIVINLLPVGLTGFTNTTKTFTIATSVAAITSFAANKISINKGSMPGPGTWSAQLDATSKQLQLVYTAGVSTPTLTGAATASAFTTTYGSASSAQSFAVSGGNLTADLTATATAGYEVSSDGSTYGTTATFTQTAGSASGTLRVRLTATATVSGSYNSQNIVLSSTGATPVNITTASTGNSVDKKPLTIGAPTIASKAYNASATAGAVTVGTLSGMAGTETVTATATAADYTSANANTYPGVVVIYTLHDGTNGGLAANYSLANGSATGVINPLPVTLSGTRPHDGTSTAAFSILTIGNKVGSDDVTVASGSATLAGSAVGSQSIVSVGSLALGGAAVVNYTLTGATGSVTITAAANPYTEYMVGVDPGKAGPMDTPQNDGVVNLLKFAFNLDVHAPDVTTLTAGATGETAGLPCVSSVAGNLRLEFLRRKASGNPGITYTPQISDTLGGWVDFGGTVISTTSIDDTWERVILEDTVGGARRFARVQVIQP